MGYAECRSTQGSYRRCPQGFQYVPVSLEKQRGAEAGDARASYSAGGGGSDIFKGIAGISRYVACSPAEIGRE